MKSELIQALIKRSEELKVVSFGQFILASGQKSNYYLDARKLGLDSWSLLLCGQLIYELLEDDTVTIGGPATGAIPLIAATLNQAALAKRPLQGFYVRPQSKNYGRQEELEGFAAAPAIVIDDVCTTGGSILKVIAKLESRGITVSKIITIFDRGGGQDIKAAGYDYASLISTIDGQLQPFSRDV